VAVKYGRDESNTREEAAAFSRELFERLTEQEIDVGAAGDPYKAGFGHGFGFVINRLFKDRPIPVVPVPLNTGPVVRAVTT
jgi:hypothetical protein